MPSRLGHLWDVLKHAAKFASWFAGITTVVFGGSVLGGAVWLLKADHRTYAILLVSAGLLSAVVEGSYRVHGEMNRQLATYQAKVVDLDTLAAREAYVDEQLAEAVIMREDIAEHAGNDPSDTHFNRICSDLNHWENEVRRTFRRQPFRDGADVFFDSEDGILASGEVPHAGHTLEMMGRYLERRETRLHTIRLEWLG